MNTHLTACEEFYGLHARPFSLTPDLRFTYHSRSHTQALEQIALALKRREGLVIVTGEVGTGKTMLCRALLETFEARTFQSVILDPLLTVEDSLHQVLADFGLMERREPVRARQPLGDVARHDSVTTLHKFLASLIPLDGHAVIMIDEAQHLSGAVLEQVRLLSNFETDSAKLLQIVLVGQPNLDLLLQRPDLQQLNQRVARRFDLQPLSGTEIQDYIERRLLVASEALPEAGRPADRSDGQATVQFTPGAIRAVAELSRGIPRLVNTICDRALEAGFERRVRVVDRKAVLAAAERLKLPVPTTTRLPRSVRIAAAAVLVLALAGGAAWWRNRGPIPPAAPAVLAPVPASAPAAPVVSGHAVPPEPATIGAEPEAAPPRPAAAPAASRIATPSTVAPSTPAAPATDAGTYEITAASFKTETRATAVVENLAAAGLPVSSHLDVSSQWYRIVVGPFRTAEEAKEAQAKLDGLGFTETRILNNAAR